ncbi:amidoligase family protein [Methylomarinum vadi]|uniref:amidoligase family protein n=1 Tax=Methylomarinum vadi TaxID=438855 RepID=UPI000562D45E|nr:amidoligase family protein [Methylomarinum vadi]
MPKSAIHFKPPSIINKDDGTPRKVGYELEFSGLDLEQAGKVLRDALGGNLRQLSAAESELTVDELGVFHIELDWNFLKRKAEENEQKEENGEWIDLLAEAANSLVPMEIVCPPIAINDLQALTPMVVGLRQAGAVGTEESLLAAYGVHINTELPSLDAETLRAYLRAFSLLQWWLVDAHDVDVARKMSPYIDLYPEAYLKKLFTEPQPTLAQIFADYLEHNASRNRALDMLPLFAHIDQEALRRVVDDPKIQARPTFHYRLPNCHIEQEDWSLADSWNTWWIVEQLAQRRDDLENLCNNYLQASRPLIGVNRQEWVEFIDQWLKKHVLA